MTPQQQAESLRQTAAAIEAKAEEKPWEYRRSDIPDAWERGFEDLTIDEFDQYEYRPKPEQPPRVLRPWKREEVPLGAEITSKISGNRYIIIGAEPSFVFLGIGAMLCEQVLSDFTLANGDPCGTYET